MPNLRAGVILLLTLAATATVVGQEATTEQQTRKQQTRQQRDPGRARAGRGAPRDFAVDPGWGKERFPEHAVCYLPAEKIRDLVGGQITSFPKPAGDVKRIVGTGHSFMAPGYRTLPAICQAAGFQQPLHLHTGGGITGSARYKWEQENGIFQFDRNPKPVLLSAIANAQWEAMVWGPYYHDRPAYYSCWIDFCLKYQTDMKFYLSDAWPQIDQLEKLPKSEQELTTETIQRLGEEKREIYARLVRSLNEEYDDRVFILPTCDAMVLAVSHYHRGELPGIEGINQFIGKKERSIWRDRLGHLGPGFERLEGYVFYATIYGRSPELIREEIRFAGRRSAAKQSSQSSFPSAELDAVFRKIAWKAVTSHPLSGVRDENQDGIAD